MLGNFKRKPLKCFILNVSSSQTTKMKILTIVLQYWQKAALKLSIEKPILLYFSYFFIISLDWTSCYVYSRLSETIFRFNSFYTPLNLNFRCISYTPCRGIEPSSKSVRMGRWRFLPDKKGDKRMKGWTEIGTVLSFKRF